MYFDISYQVTIGTALQRQAWQCLTKIPYGKTSGYKSLANITSSPNAIRSISTNLGRNPLLIILPCYRILRIDGLLGGYAGGLNAKKYLLNLEKRSSDIRCG